MGMKALPIRGRHIAPTQRCEYVASAVESLGRGLVTKRNNPAESSLLVALYTKIKKTRTYVRIVVAYRLSPAAYRQRI